MPAEIVVNQEMAADALGIKTIQDKFNSYITIREPSEVEIDIQGFSELDKLVYAKDATRLLLLYIKETQKIDLKHINLIQNYEINDFMVLDSIARKNLELTETLRDKNKKGSLIWVLDKTSTSMGGRLLRRWIEKPLINVEEINYRHVGVKELKENIIKRDDILSTLKNVYDIERLTGKVAYGSISARDLVSLKNSLLKLPAVKDLIKDCTSPIINEIYNQMDTLDDIAFLCIYLAPFQHLILKLQYNIQKLCYIQLSNSLFLLLLSLLPQHLLPNFCPLSMLF